MKTIPKKTLDELIRFSRKYWKSGDVDIFPAKNQTAFKLSAETFGHENNWLCLCNFVDGAIRLDKGVTNQMIYEAFGAIGFEVERSEPCEKESEETV